MTFSQIIGGRGFALIPKQTVGGGSVAWADVTGKPAILTSLAGLANASGVLKNDGAGALSYISVTEGGNGIADAGKIPLFNGDGALCSTLGFTVKGNGFDNGFLQLLSADNTNIGQLDYDGVNLSNWLLRGTGANETVAFLSDASNPSVSVGLAAINGVATTFMRSDSAPALSQAIEPTWTGHHVFSKDGVASIPPLMLSGIWYTVGGTSTTTKPHLLIEPTGTTSTGWSTSGTGLGINAASGFTGNLLDLQIAGARAARFYPSGDGSLLTLSDRVTTTNAFATLQASNNLNCVKGGDGGATRWALGQNVDSGFNSGLLVQSSYIIGFTSGTVAGSSADVKLVRDGAGVLAQKNSTNAQTTRIYGTYTDSSNYTRLSLAATSTTMTIAAETAGTGADDIDLAFTPSGTGCVKFGTHSAIGAEIVTGYITIKDSNGNTRKLAVVS